MVGRSKSHNLIAQQNIAYGMGTILFAVLVMKYISH
jgi:hypothetical protein